MRYVASLLLAATLLLTAAPWSAEAQTQTVRTLDTESLWDNWEDFQDWFLFVGACEEQNMLVLKVFQQDVTDTVEKLKTARSEGSATEEDLKDATTGVERRILELKAFQKVQKQITDYKIKQGREKRTKRVLDEVERLSAAQSFDLVILDEENVTAFNDKSLDVTNDLTTQINGKDREDLIKLRESKQGGADMVSKPEDPKTEDPKTE